MDENWCADASTYNIRKGGKGGFTKENSSKGRKLADKVIFEKYGIQNPFQLEKCRLRASLRMTERHLLGLSKYDNFRGKRHTEDTKRKISQTNSEKQKGCNNSQFGTFWITDGDTNKKIKSSNPIPEGWVRGRKIQPRSNTL